MNLRSWKILVAGATLMAVSCVDDYEHAVETDEAPDEAFDEPTSLMAPPSELHHFERLDDMVATSTAVIDGEVIEVAPGRVVGGDDGIQFEEATILVHEVLAGGLSANTVILEMEGWDTDGNRFIHPYGLEPNREGDRGVYFLWQKREPTPEPRYRLINTQGRHLETEMLAAPTREDPLTQELARMGTEPLRAAVLAAQPGEPVPPFVHIPDLVETEAETEASLR